MENKAQTIGENKENDYDWNNISIGFPELNCSGKFFGKRKRNLIA